MMNSDVPTETPTRNAVVENSHHIASKAITSDPISQVNNGPNLRWFYYEFGDKSELIFKSTSPLTVSITDLSVDSLSALYAPTISVALLVQNTISTYFYVIIKFVVQILCS